MIDNLLQQKINKINIWASKSSTKSNLHYDFYDNFLQVLHGCKRVYMWSPNEKIITQATNSYELDSHEGKINFLDFYKDPKIKSMLTKRRPDIIKSQHFKEK